MLIVNTAVRRQAEEDVLSPLCFLSAGNMRLNLNPPSLRPGRIRTLLFVYVPYLLNGAASLRRPVRARTS